MADRVYHRLGQTYMLQVIPIDALGAFLSGLQIYAYVQRNSDQAMFNFAVYNSDPSGQVWVGGQTGNPIPSYPDLAGELPEFKLDTISLAYQESWNFPENKDTEDSDPQVYTIWYYSPGSLGLIGSEQVVFMPKALSFNAYYASPVSEGQFTVRQS